MSGSNKKPILNSSGVSLYLIVFLLFLVITLIVAGIQAFGPRVIKYKNTSTRNILEADVDSIISWSAANGRIPDSTPPTNSPTYFSNVLKNPNDAFGKSMVYIYDSNIASVATGGLCGITSAAINTSTGISDVAFLLFSGGQNHTVYTNSGNSGPFSGTLQVDTRDMVRAVTRTELQGKAGCFGRTGGYLRIVNTELPGACAGGSYKGMVFADGGAPFGSGGKYKWCFQGAYPGGISSSVSTCPTYTQVDYVNVTGSNVTASPGNYFLTFSAQDNNSVVQKNLPLNVSSTCGSGGPPPITVPMAQQNWTNWSPVNYTVANGGDPKHLTVQYGSGGVDFKQTGNSDPVGLITVNSNQWGNSSLSYSLQAKVDVSSSFYMFGLSFLVGNAPNNVPEFYGISFFRGDGSSGPTWWPYVTANNSGFGPLNNGKLYLVLWKYVYDPVSGNNYYTLLNYSQLGTSSGVTTDGSTLNTYSAIVVSFTESGNSNSISAYTAGPFAWSNGGTNYPAYLTVANGEPISWYASNFYPITWALSPYNQPLTDNSLIAAGGGATANVTVSGGAVTGVPIINGGSGYSSTLAPLITINGGGGQDAAANDSVSGGAITNISVATPGSGYTSAPTAIIGFGVGIHAYGSKNGQGKDYITDFAIKD